MQENLNSVFGNMKQIATNNRFLWHGRSQLYRMAFLQHFICPQSSPIPSPSVQYLSKSFLIPPAILIQHEFSKLRRKHELKLVTARQKYEPALLEFFSRTAVYMFLKIVSSSI